MRAREWADRVRPRPTEPYTDEVNQDCLDSIALAIEDAVKEEREVCTKIVEKQLRAVSLNGGNDAATYWLTRAIAEIRATNG